jgi:hypothetical protein
MKGFGKYLVFLFPIVGIGLFVLGLRFRRRLKVRVKGFERTAGKVTDNINAAEGFRAVVEYFVGGKSYSVTSQVERNPRQKEGNQLAVMYDPAKPWEGIVAEEYYLVANVLLAIGGVFVLLGSLLTYYLVLVGE